MQSLYLTTALRAAKAAEEIILHHFGKDISAETKSDLSPVTVADRQAEAKITEVIKRQFPDHTFYGEEGEKVDLTNRRGFTWIIDPIDGTKSYVRGNPLFATQIALLKDGDLVLGVSNAPLMNELMYAEKGHGCFLNDQPAKVSTTISLDEAYASFGSVKYFDKRGSVASLMHIASSAKWARGIGDFWSYHLLAQGKIDIMLEADTKLWDIAALKVIVEEAGGMFTTMDGSPIDVNVSSVIATNKKLHNTVVDLFAPQ